MLKTTELLSLNTHGSGAGRMKLAPRSANRKRRGLRIVEVMFNGKHYNNIFVGDDEPFWA